MKDSTATRLVCAGCGTLVPSIEPYPFRCSAAVPGDDIDHVVTRVLDPESVTFPESGDPNPFIRYRRLFHTYHLAAAGGLGDDEYCDLVARISESIAAVAGIGFTIGPLKHFPALEDRLSPTAGRVLVKDETGGVAGSHKGRHLMGVLLQLEIAEHLGLAATEDRTQRSLAIASCGNAALAAAVLARASGRPLKVFVPTSADANILKQLQELGADVVRCERRASELGDPCLAAFHEAVANGALPFCCQGPDCGLNIDGGRTLGYELITACLEQDIALDHLFIQVGGGALASATSQAFEDAAQLGALAGPGPRIHAIQAVGNAPLLRAYESLETELAVPGRTLQSVLEHAASRRSAFMKPWPTEPRSIASGILDDEAYDWRAILRNVFQSGGTVETVDEDELARARSLGVETTGIDVGPTGAAGLAGLLHLDKRGGELSPDEASAVLFTGAA